MIKITWFDGNVPSNLKITQVYGIIFSLDGRILLKIEDGKYSFAGGTPEEFDTSMVATLRRELIEEVNVVIDEPILVGYQEIDEGNGKLPYAQVRMCAMIKNIGVSKPDPDNNKIYQRVLVSPKKAIELLGWGEIGKNQIEAAIKIAEREFGVCYFSEKEEYI